MIQPKEEFVDKIGQSFSILRQNFALLMFTIILYNLIFWVLVPSMFWMLFPVENLIGSSQLSIESILYSPFFVYLSVGISIYWILYALLIIPINLSILFTLRDIVAWNHTHSHLSYLSIWVKNTFKSFRTYWYIFSYVYMIPALVFIFWGILWIIGLHFGYSLDSFLMIVAKWLVIASIILFCFFALYRGFKSSFWMISAVDAESFTQENFSQSLTLSKWKWWRVFLNIFWVGFVVWMLLNFFKFLWGIVFPSKINYEYFLDRNIMQGMDNEMIIDVVSQITQFQLLPFINKAIQNTLASIAWVGIVIFVYLFFKQLTQESAHTKNSPGKMPKEL